MLIEDIDLFKGISPLLTREIGAMAEEEAYPAEHVLFERGETASFFYILIEGRIDIRVKGQPGVSIPAHEAGTVFGWSALVEPYRYTAEAVCMDSSKVVKIRGEDLMHVLQKYPSDALTVMKRLTKLIASRTIGKFSIRTEP
ncbi:MAG: cyclic nucleotide-binding domain-containing protein [Deltaproteobacteria bacterium]|nr:cyclic nucleotide-binding domain-containing protein [Deltaproteobacteria bacterium]